MRKWFLVAAGALLIAPGGLWLITSAQAPVGAALKPAAQFTNDQLMRPENYREWIFVGCPVTPNDMNNGHAAFPEFHDVYIDRTAYEEYARTGTFPEGTVFVKELVSVGAKQAASGKGYFPGKIGGIAAAVKDSKRFGGDRNGWGYFNFGEAKTASVMGAADCNACHKQNAAEDMVFTQYYPVLGAAKAEPKAMPPEKTEKGTTSRGYTY